MQQDHYFVFNKIVFNSFVCKNFYTQHFVPFCCKYYNKKYQTLEWLGITSFNWSGRRDSNPRPSPWQGDALPLSYFRTLAWLVYGAKGRNRTADTGIFSPLLYLLSYLGIIYGGADGIRTRGLLRDRQVC